MFGQCVVVTAADKDQPLHSLGAGGRGVTKYSLEWGSWNTQVMFKQNLLNTGRDNSVDANLLKPFLDWEISVSVKCLKLFPADTSDIANYIKHFFYVKPFKYCKWKYLQTFCYLETFLLMKTQQLEAW